MCHSERSAAKSRNFEFPKILFKSEDGAAVSLSAIFFTIYPIIDVPSPLSFAVKIIAVTVIANAIGIAIFVLGARRRPAEFAQVC